MGKYAVIVGINYVKNPEAALKGCCNDARIMKRIVESKGFEEQNIRLIVDDDDKCPDPSGAEVKKALQWLCTGRSDSDVIFFHFSGHGTQIPCDGDDVEEDGKDEAIVLENMYLMCDDDLKQFFSLLPTGCKTTCITDCCHSGSMLDGENVTIQGAKDSASAAPHAESDSLLAILGGTRDVAEISHNRSLPIGTIASVLSGTTGKQVSPTGKGVNGALAQYFGGDAGKLCMQFALSQLGGGKSSGKNALASLTSTMMGSASKVTPGGGLGNGGGNAKMKVAFLTALLGCFGKSQAGAQGQGKDPLSQLLGGGDPLGNLTSMLGGLGLEGQKPMSGSGAPPFKPATGSTRDVATLITGCQAHETSADVRPANGEAFGALTKTLSDVYFANRNISHYDLVSQVRTTLSKGGFKQNPCLECNSTNAKRTFICDV